MKKTKQWSLKGGLKYISFTYRERITIQKILKRFYIVNEEYVNTKYKSSMILMGSVFVYELINFYNKNVSLNAGICKSTKYNSTNNEKLKYYLELFYTKLVICWEYLFSYINEYLKTGLMPNKQVREELIANQMGKSPGKKLIILTPDKLKRKIGEIYEESELINDIFECYSDTLVTEARYIRNLIVHSDSLQKNFSFGVNDIFHDVAICSRDTDYFSKLISRIDDNMFMLKKALLLFKEMVINDKIPNHIENAGKKFKTYDYKCGVCDSEYTVPDMLEEYFKKYVTCTQCRNKKFSKISENQVSELFYGTLVNNLLNKWEKDCYDIKNTYRD